MQAEKKWNAKTIRDARLDFRMTQADLATELGCRQQTVSEWEVGLYAPINAYQKLLTHVFSKESSERTKAIAKYQ